MAFVKISPIPSCRQISLREMENLPEPVLDAQCEMDRLPLPVLELVLKKVFEVLPRKDRKSGVMVNSLWRKVGEAPHLWAWVQLPLRFTKTARQG